MLLLSMRYMYVYILQLQISRNWSNRGFIGFIVLLFYNNIIFNLENCMQNKYYHYCYYYYCITHSVKYYTHFQFCGSQQLIYINRNTL